MTFEIFNPCIDKLFYKEIKTLKELLNMCREYNCSMIVSPWADVSDDPNIGNIIIYNTYLE